jgi:hypothetical protein
MFVTFPTSHVERLPLKAIAPLNTAPQQQRKVQGKKMGLEKKKKKERALCSKIELVLPQKEDGKIEATKEGGGKSVRTVCHGRHFPDLPGREITIEGISISKHCTQQQRKVQG